MEQITEMLTAGQRDMEWFQRSLKRLVSEYDRRFIAFQNHTILDTDTDLDRLMKRLESKRIDTSRVFIEFVSKIKSIL